MKQKLQIRYEAGIHVHACLSVSKDKTRAGKVNRNRIKRIWLFQRDFQPIDITANLTHKAQVPHSTIRVPDVKFDSRTSFGEFFKNYGPVKRERYGDFHENRPYIPPQTKFDGSSTTKSTFTPKKWEPTRPFVPENRPIESQGAMDFSTVHNETYQKPKVKPCKAEIYLIQKELRRQKALEARAVAAK